MISIATRSPSSSLQIKGLATKYTTAKWLIRSACVKVEVSLINIQSESQVWSKSTHYKKFSTVRNLKF